MTAKEKQVEFIRTYLKPTLKSYGFKNKGQTWWEDKGEFFILINLQNFSWNSIDSVDFCFNMGIILKTIINYSPKTVPNIHDSTIYLREEFFLPDNRKEHVFKNKSGYTITELTNLEDFIAALKTDFECHILIQFRKLNSLQDCIDKFEDLPFWGTNLKKVIEENNQLLN
jgi:hypothetical protein